MLFPAYWRDDLANNWYVIGLNYPGIPGSGAGGYHLGPNQIMNHDVNRVTEQTLTTLQQDFRRIRNMGCRVVRMWAFTQGQGLRWREGTDEWTVTRIDPDFERNVRNITERAARERIKIYWTLFNGADCTVDTRSEPARTMKQSFRSIVDDQVGGSHRSPLITSVLPRFVSAIQTHRDGVFAIDLMNEPDTLWRESIVGDICSLYGGTGLASLATSIALRFVLDRTPIDDDDYLSFFRESSDCIRAASEWSIPISIGFTRFHSIRRHLSTLNTIVDFFDYHHYNHFDVADTGFHPLPNWGTVHSQKPCIIGECGLGGQFQQEYGTPAISWDWLRNRSPNTFAEAFRGTSSSAPAAVTLREVFDAQALCISNVMQESYDRGYAGCLVWEYGKQYDDTRRATSPFNPRNLDDQADWGDRFHMIWRPAPGSRVPAGYNVPLNPRDSRITGRAVIQEMNLIFQDHLSGGRCPPVHA